MERHGEKLLLPRISVASSSERLRSTFGMTLFGVFRRADLVASEDGHRFHVLTLVREAGNAELLVKRIRKIAGMLNQRSPSESLLDVRVETVEE